MMKFTVALILSVCLAASAFGDKSIAASDSGNLYRNNRDALANGQQQNCVSVTTADGQKATVCGEPAQIAPAVNRNFEETAADERSAKATEARTFSLLHKKLEKPAQIYFVQQPQYVEKPHVEYVPKPVYQPIYYEKPVPVYVPQPVYQSVQHVQPQQHNLCDYGSYGGYGGYGSYGSYGKSAGPEGMVPFSRSVETTHYVNKVPVSRNVETSGPIGYGGMTGYGNMGGMSGMSGMAGMGYGGMNRGYGMVRPTVMPYRYRSADETEAPTPIDGYVTDSEVANIPNTEWNTMRSAEEQPAFGLPEQQMAAYLPMSTMNNMRAAEQPMFGFPESQMISTPQQMGWNNFKNSEGPTAYGQPQFVNSIQPQFGTPMTMRSMEPMPMGVAAPSGVFQSYPMMRTANDIIYSGLVPMSRTVEVPTVNNMQQQGNLQTIAPSKDSNTPPMNRREAEITPKDSKPKSTDQTKTVSEGVTKN